MKSRSRRVVQPAVVEESEEPDEAEQPATEAENYLISDKANIEFFSSGCTVLDCALGGGWALGRMVNVVGDKSTAKTGLVIEAQNNFIMKFPTGRPAYRESEGAFDKGYAKVMGMPVDRIDFGNEEEPIHLVEDFIRDYEAFVDDRRSTGEAGLYGLDSFDALSDSSEIESDIAKGSYGTTKAKMSSALFRRVTKKMEGSRSCLMIVSQVRENINAMFGERYKRSGGKALDFYASQIVWLAHIKTLTRTIKKVERPYGITIHAKVKKNKVGLPLREAVFDYMFGYGIDDLGATFRWLKDVNRLEAAGFKLKDYPDLARCFTEMSEDEYHKTAREAAVVVKEFWREIEKTFLPTKAKYRW